VLAFILLILLLLFLELLRQLHPGRYACREKTRVWRSVSVLLIVSISLEIHENFILEPRQFSNAF